MKMNINKSMGQKYIWIDYENGCIWRYSDKKFRNKKGWFCYGNTEIKTDYYKMNFNGKLQYLHRIIYSFYHKIPLHKLGEIDHVNRIKRDNSISNLRLVTFFENRLNEEKYSTNISGYKNISFLTQKIDGYFKFF